MCENEEKNHNKWINKIRLNFKNKKRDVEYDSLLAFFNICEKNSKCAHEKIGKI